MNELVSNPGMSNDLESFRSVLNRMSTKLEGFEKLMVDLKVDISELRQSLGNLLETTRNSAEFKQTQSVNHEVGIEESTNDMGICAASDPDKDAQMLASLNSRKFEKKSNNAGDSTLALSTLWHSQSSFRRLSQLMSPAEINKVNRIQRIHNRLALMTPKKTSCIFIFKNSSGSELIQAAWKKFLRGTFGIQASKIGEGEEGSRIIHPASCFNTLFETMRAILLVCTIFLVPLELSFLDNKNVCSVDLYLIFNLGVDTFFLVDLFYHFFVGITTSNGKYVDSITEVARIYFWSADGFWFNLLTSLPMGWVNWALIKKICGDSEDRGSSSFYDDMLLAAIKPVRAVRLIRILRVSAIWGNLIVRFNLRPTYFRAITSVCLLIMALHVSACGFWLLKAELNHEDLVTNLLGSRGLTTNDVGGCYILCLYFMVTIFATGAFRPLPSSSV